MSSFKQMLDRIIGRDTSPEAVVPQPDQAPMAPQLPVPLSLVEIEDDSPFSVVVPVPSTEEIATLRMLFARSEDLKTEEVAGLLLRLAGISKPESIPAKVAKAKGLSTFAISLAETGIACWRQVKENNPKDYMPLGELSGAVGGLIESLWAPPPELLNERGVIFLLAMKVIYNVTHWDYHVRRVFDLPNETAALSGVDTNIDQMHEDVVRYGLLLQRERARLAQEVGKNDDALSYDGFTRVLHEESRHQLDVLISFDIVGFEDVIAATVRSLAQCLPQKGIQSAIGTVLLSLPRHQALPLARRYQRLLANTLRESSHFSLVAWAAFFMLLRAKERKASKEQIKAELVPMVEAIDALDSSVRRAFNFADGLVASRS